MKAIYLYRNRSTITKTYVQFTYVCMSMLLYISIKYNNRFEMCLWIYSEDASHLFLNCLLYVEQGTVPFYLLYHHNIRRYIRTLLFGDSQKTWLKIVCNQKQYRHSLRTLIDSLKEHNPYTPHILLICHQYMFCIIHAYILIIHHAPYQTYVYMMLEGTLYKL